MILHFEIQRPSKSLSGPGIIHPIRRAGSGPIPPAQNKCALCIVENLRYTRWYNTERWQCLFKTWANQQDSVPLKASASIAVHVRTQAASSLDFVSILRDSPRKSPSHLVYA